MKISSFRELKAYQAARYLAQALFDESKAWPKEEAYSLTRQFAEPRVPLALRLQRHGQKEVTPPTFLAN